MGTNSTETQATDANVILDGSAPQMTYVLIDQLVPFKHHVFKPYSKQRMDTLVASVQENGIIHPIFVRRIKGKDGQEQFEIISGHNRVEAAKLAKMKEVPAVIKELSDDDAVILANEANIESRSFQTWLSSEKIKSISQYHAAVKSQGKAKGPKSASGDKRQKPEDNYARQRTAKVYGISPSIVKSFIAMSHLINPLQDRLDAGDFGTTPASEISFIFAAGQELINSVLNEDTKKKIYRVTTKRSETLRKYFYDEVDESRIAENEEAIREKVREILSKTQGTPSETVTDKPVRIPIPQEDFKELFPNAPALEDVAAIIVQCIRHCIEENFISRDKAV